MHIIIAGAGEVGFHLAKLLTNEAQDIVLIDTNEERLQYVSNQIDVATVHGSSTSFRILEEAEVGKTDLLISATPTEETNLATAMIAKKLGAKRTIARISNLEFLFDKHKLDLRHVGIDSLISPESLAAREIKRLLRQASLTDTFEFDRGILSLIGIKIEKGDYVINKTLKELGEMNKDNTYVLAAILRENKTIIPNGKTKILANDHLYFITNTDGVDKVYKLKKHAQCKIKKVMILGGSKTGVNAAKKLCPEMRVKLIEKDKDKCIKLADELQDTLIINGEASDTDLLKQESIEDMDAFIAVTGNSETNIISCLSAKKLGVKKTIALVENIAYIHLSQEIGVDTLINKKIIAANFIFRYIRQGNIISIAGVHGLNAEILEFEVGIKSSVYDKKIKEIEFPKSSIVCGVIRNNEGIIASGDLKFKAKDRVVILTKPEAIKPIEKLFCS